MNKEVFEIIVGLPYDHSESEKLVKDFTIISVNSNKNVPFYFNLSILKSSSNVISLYESQNPGKNTFTVDPNQLSEEDIILFRDFVYGKKIEINYSTIERVKKIANFFNSTFLLEKCSLFQKYVSSIKTVIKIINNQINIEKFMKLIAQHFYIFRISKFLNQCDLLFLYQILTLPNLCDKSEESICLFLMERLTQIKDMQQVPIEVYKILGTIRSELFSDTFCQHLITTYEIKKDLLLPLIQRRLTYEKENDFLPNRIYQKNDIETCLEQFFIDYSNLAS